MTKLELNQYIPLLHFLLAHLVADFLMQTKKMVDNKGWFTGQMGLHIFIVFSTALLFTGNLQWALLVAPIHWITDGIKTESAKRGIGTELKRFLLDQLCHILTVLIIWAATTGNTYKILDLIQQNWFGYKGSIILAAYITVIWPLAFIIKIATTNINKNTETFNDENVQQGSFLIGEFERVIILTLVLLGQYPVIGLLIIAKSIFRFAKLNEKFTSDYVLYGTLMSYALSILIGVITNLLLQVQL